MLTPELETAIKDLTRKAAMDSLDAALRSASLMPHPEIRAAILLRCALRLTQAAAATYAALDGKLVTDLTGQDATRYFQAIIGAWGNYPDDREINLEMVRRLMMLRRSGGEASS